MKLQIRTTLIASAIAALLAGPTWAASDASKEGAYDKAPTKAEIGQPERDGSTAAQPTSETPRISDTPRLRDSPRLGAAADGDTTRTSIANNPLYTRSADDLDGVDVVDSRGDKIGEIKRVVLAPDRKSAHAVISVGGVLGMGARDVLVSLDALKPMDDKLQINDTKEQIESRKDDEAKADSYVEVKGDTPISGSIVEFSAFEQGNGATKPGADSMSPRMDSDKPGATSTTPKVGVDKPATIPATPRVPQ